MFVIKYRKIFFIISLLLVFVSLFAIIGFGLNLGTDFTGGTIAEVVYLNGAPSKDEVRTALLSAGFSSVSVQPTNDNGYLIRMKTITEQEHETLNRTLSFGGSKQFEERRFSSIGPIIGQELARKGIIAITLVVILIIFYIALVFRQVSAQTGGVSSWKYGLIAVVALAHDVVIPTGVFAFMGEYYGTEIDALFLTALLTILGLSVNDTIVIFDRVRENLRNKVSPHFAETVGISLNQTFTRSIITSLMLIIVLLSLYLLGGPTTRDFALVLTIGMAVGTYSSIFLAAPLLVQWQKTPKH